MKDGWGPCEYKCLGSLCEEDNTIFCNKLNTRIPYDKCGHGICKDYMEEFDDYDWKDHWC